jgi:hypothetical protein
MKSQNAEILIDGTPWIFYFVFCWEDFMSVVSETQNFYPLGTHKDLLVPPLKKRRIEPKAIDGAALPATTKMTVQDVSRKNFLQFLCVHRFLIKSESLSKNKVYVICSALQNETEKLKAITSAILKVQRKCPDKVLEMLWVNIPKEEFFTADHFEKMKTAIYSIPFHSIICFQTGDAFISPKRAIMAMAPRYSMKLRSSHPLRRIETFALYRVIRCNSIARGMDGSIIRKKVR